MAEYLSPGVYVEEVDAGPKPIEGVSTSTTGAVGVTARGPTTGKPELVTSFADFQRRFGGFLPEPPNAIQVPLGNNLTEGGRWWDFPLAVKSYFDNGGQRLYVKRVFAGSALPVNQQNVNNSAVAANAALWRGLVVNIERDAAPTNPPTNLALILSHLIGITVGTVVTLVNGSNGQQIGGNFTVTTYDATTRRVTFNAQLPANSDVRADRGDQVLIVAPVAAVVANNDTFLTVSARARGGYGNDVRVRIAPIVASTLALLPDPAGGGAPVRTNATAIAPGANATTWVVTVTAVAGFANGDTVSVLGIDYVIANVNAGANTFDIQAAANPNWPANTVVDRVRGAAAAGAQSLRVWGANQLYTDAVVELDNGSAKELRQVQSVAGDVITLNAATANAYLEGQRMRVIEFELTAQYRPNNTLETEEVISNLRLVGRNTPNYIVDRVRAESELVEVADTGVNPQVSYSAFPVTQTGRWQSLANGNDNFAALTVDDFVGLDGGSGSRTGIAALEDIDEISICVAPGVWSRTVHNALIQHCELLKDRFAIIDPRDRLDIEGIRTFREVYDTKYAAIYYPWVVARDPSRRANVRLAPSGAMAGIYARVDVARGVHKAPANEAISSITELGADVTKREQDMLNPRNINVLRYFPGRGNRVWGARCVTSDASWKYINVRRLFIMIEESIDEGTQWVVFEPNDEPTWARVRLSITNFLNTQWRNGALQGATAAEAFFVKCDRTTMTQDDIDNGRLICVIGIAPVKPAEFVIFRIQQKTLDTNTN
jgi:phage tail sheath protein FI